MIRSLLATLGLTLFFLYIALFNPQSVTVRLTKSISYTVPFVVVALVLIMVGFLGAYLLTFVREIKWSFVRVRDRRWIKQQEERFYSLWKALVFYEMGDKEKTEGLLKKMLSKGPFNVEAQVLMGRVSRERGNREEALSLHRGARREGEDNEGVLYELYLDHVSMGEWEEALEILQQLMKRIKPAYPLWKELVKVYRALGEYEKAYKVQERVVKMAPEGLKEKEEGILPVLLFEGAKDSGEPSKFQSIVKRYPQFVPAYLALLDLEKDARKMAPLLEKACEKAPRFPILLEKLEGIYLAEERPGTMINFYKKLRSLYPNEKLVSFMWARFYLSLGMYQDARELVFSMDGEEKALQFLRAKLHDKLAEREEALRIYDEAIGKEMGLIYRCAKCEAEHYQWVDKCPFCNEWNTLRATFQ